MDKRIIQKSLPRMEECVECQVDKIGMFLKTLDYKYMTSVVCCSCFCSS